MSIIQPFDFESIFVTTLSGTPEIFSFLAVIAISGLAAFFRMRNSIALILFALFGIIMSQYIGGFYVLIILIGGLSVFYGISKIIKY